MKLSELIKLIEEGKQPNKIRVIDKGQEATFVWRGNHYITRCIESLEIWINNFKETTIIDLDPKEILDKEEKEYLRNVIKPFRDDVESISKKRTCLNNLYIIIITKTSTTILPNLKNDKMYKGMEINYEYTLEELGL